MSHLAPRFVRRTWRRLWRNHRDLITSLLIGAIFVVVGIVAARKLIP